MSDDNKKQNTTGGQTSPIVFSEDTVPPFSQNNPTPPVTVGIPETPKVDSINPSPIDIPNTTSGSAAPTQDIVTDTVMPAVVTTGAPKKKFAGGKVIATILGLFVLVGGLGAGVYLTGQNQNIAEKASWEQDQRCEELRRCGQGCRQEYRSDCGGDDDTPPPPPAATPTPPPAITAQCQNILAFTETWVALPGNTLSTLKVGDKVNFCVNGVATGGSFNKAKFTINGVEQAETTTKRPSSEDFCQLYTIPAGTTTFSVTAKINHNTLGYK